MSALLASTWSPADSSARTLLGVTASTYAYT